MSETTTVRIDRSTHDTLQRLARTRSATVTEVVAHAVRLLHQEQMGSEVARDLDRPETEWLDADLG